MRLAHYAGRACFYLDNRVSDIQESTGRLFSSDIQDTYARWDELRSWYEQNQGSLSWADADTALFGSPVPRPQQVLAVGLNYGAHARESGFEVPTQPVVFTKFPSCLSGPVDPIPLTGDRVDWEVELVAVMSSTVGPGDVFDPRYVIAGITLGQDISDRDTQLRGQAPQFSMGKSYPGYGPMGPVLVSLDEVEDLGAIDLRCEINGEVVQDGDTGSMIIGILDLVTLLAKNVILNPGDIIFTGTPEGVGIGRTPPLFLKPGDVVTSYSSVIGTMTNRCEPANY